MKKQFILITITSLVIFSGCSSKKTLYNYEDYSEAYYDYKKNPSKESLQALQSAMVEAIENASDSQSNRVPPGMYANLGYIYLKQGKKKLAIEYFQKEKALYPESTIFMNRMIQKVQALEGNNNAK